MGDGHENKYEKIMWNNFHVISMSHVKTDFHQTVENRQKWKI